MRRKIGVILFDQTSVLIRIYLVEADKPKLLLSHSMYPALYTRPSFLASMTTYFHKHARQYDYRWTCASRTLSRETAEAITERIKQPIEILSPSREQELLCAGLASETSSVSEDML